MSQLANEPIRQMPERNWIIVSQVIEFLLLLVLVLMLAGCTRELPMRTATPSAISTPALPPPFSLDALKNAEFDSEFTASGRAKLTNGIYKEPAAPGSAAQIQIALTDFVAFGDLNSDGVDDAVAILTESGGGSGTFYRLVVIVNQNDKPTPVADFPLGDRVKINSVAIQAGTIAVNMVTHAPTDPSCCPTLPVIRAFRLQSALAPVIEGTYKAQLPAADAAGRNMTLVLNADKSCALTTEFVGKPDQFVEKGTWSAAGDAITIRLTEQNSKPENVEITFDFKDGDLVATKWDKTLYGTAGPGRYKRQ